MLTLNPESQLDQYYSSCERRALALGHKHTFFSKKDCSSPSVNFPLFPSMPPPPLLPSCHQHDPDHIRVPEHREQFSSIHHQGGRRDRGNNKSFVPDEEDTPGKQTDEPPHESEPFSEVNRTAWETTNYLQHRPYLSHCPSGTGRGTWNCSLDQYLILRKLTLAKVIFFSLSLSELNNHPFLLFFFCQLYFSCRSIFL